MSVNKYNYGYFPAGPLADFWREHDARQRAKRCDDLGVEFSKTATAETKKKRNKDNDNSQS